MPHKVVGMKVVEIVAYTTSLLVVDITPGEQK